MTDIDPSPDAPVTRRSASSEIDRRTIIWSAVVLVGALLVGVIVVAVTYDPGPTNPAPAQTGGAEAPRIIPQPNSGTAPDDAGDRGGWEQLALMGLIMAALVGIGIVALRGPGSKARAGREAWKAAAATGRDGAVGQGAAAPADPADPGADTPQDAPDARV